MRRAGDGVLGLCRLQSFDARHGSMKRHSLLGSWDAISPAADDAPSTSHISMARPSHLPVDSRRLPVDVEPRRSGSSSTGMEQPRQMRAFRVGSMRRALGPWHPGAPRLPGRHQRGENDMVLRTPAGGATAYLVGSAPDAADDPEASRETAGTLRQRRRRATQSMPSRQGNDRVKAQPVRVRAICARSDGSQGPRVGR